MSNKFAGMTLPVDVPEQMKIVHPVTRQILRDSKGKEAFIELYSADSDVARKHQREVMQRRIAMRRAKVSAEEVEASGTEVLVTLTKSWHLVGLDGAPLEVPCDPDNARELYSASGMAWLREQVDEFVFDRANFTKASSTN